jgi:hypothetical protein
MNNVFFMFQIYGKFVRPPEVSTITLVGPFFILLWDHSSASGFDLKD